MTYTVQELAQKYAEALVRYHELRLHSTDSGLREDKLAFRRATDDLCLAQNLLDSAAIRAAELSLGLGNDPTEFQDIGCEFDQKLV